MIRNFESVDWRRPHLANYPLTVCPTPTRSVDGVDSNTEMKANHVALLVHEFPCGAGTDDATETLSPRTRNRKVTITLNGSAIIQVTVHGVIRRGCPQQCRFVEGYNFRGWRFFVEVEV